MKTITLAVLTLLLVSLDLQAQPDTSHYHGPMWYSIPQLQAVPPLYPGQDPDVSFGYLWADQLMRTTSWNKVDRYLNTLTSVDTLKFLAAALYRGCHDNPLALFQWENSDTYRLYRSDPGHSRYSLEKNTIRVFNDSGRTAELLRSDLIMHVAITDTMTIRSPYDSVSMSLVTATVVDTIKGRYIPTCPAPLLVPKSKNRRLSDSFPVSPTNAVRAVPGACIQFEYSPDWNRGGSDIKEFGNLRDSSGAPWIKVGKEYIVFLYFEGEGQDSSQIFFSVKTGLGGIQEGMYLISNGLVDDPYDDFGFGSSLTAIAWKVALRNRITNLIAH